MSVAGRPLFNGATFGTVGAIGRRLPLISNLAKPGPWQLQPKAAQYVCITTYQPATKSNPNPNPNPNATT